MCTEYALMCQVPCRRTWWWGLHKEVHLVLLSTVFHRFGLVVKTSSASFFSRHALAMDIRRPRAPFFSIMRPRGGDLSPAELEQVHSSWEIRTSENFLHARLSQWLVATMV